MKRNKASRILALFLTLLMIIGSVNITAFASEKSSNLGYVTVSFEDYGVRDPDDYGDYPNQLGKIVNAQQVALYEDDTMATVTLRLLESLGIIASYSGSPESGGGFYLQTINNFTTPGGVTVNDDYGLGEFSVGSMSGWMVSLNNWFVNMGTSEFGVENGMLENGDVIRWKFTATGYGADIGCDWSNASARITGLLIDSQYGTLSPAFTDGIKKYTLTVNSDVKNIKMEAQQENYWSTLTYRVGDTYYKLLSDIPVDDGTVITIDSAYAAYAGEEPSDTDCVTITIDKEAPVNGYLSALKLTNGTSTTSAKYMLKPASGDNTRNYTVMVPDTASAFSVWATLSDSAPSGSTITAKWTNTSNAAKTQAIPSGNSTGQSLSGCFIAGGIGNTVEIVVGSGEDTQTYVITIVRKRTLSALTVEANGSALVLSPAFDKSITTYITRVLDTTQSVTVTPTPYAASSKGYAVTVNGKTVEDGGNATVALNETNTSIPVVVSYTDGSSNTYTITVHKVAAASVSFDMTPADATLVLADAAGKSIQPDNGAYTLLSGASYTYTVTKYGYIGQTHTFRAVSGTMGITLSQATANSAIDITVPAQWKNFRGSDNNMGITSAKTPVSPEGTALKWAVKMGSGWANAPSVQIIVDDALIVMSNTTISKLNLETGETVASATMVSAPSYGYTPPTYAEGIIFVPLGGGIIQAFNAKTLESLWVYTDKLGGQALSPITYSDGYIYTGFWNGETKSANYVCVSVTDEDKTKTTESKLATWTKTVTGGFYWAGSVAVGNTVIFGTDDGTGDYNAASSHLYAVNKYTGAVISSLDIIGDQRSSIAYDSASGRVYFTTKCGYLYSAAVNASTGALSDLKGVNYNAQSTSTPIVYGGKVYFATGSGISSSGSNGNFVVANAETLEMIYTVGLLGYPQSSLLLSTAYYESEGLLYFYSTYNMTPGGISLIKVDPTKNTAEEGAKLQEIYDAAGYSQYCIASIICDKNGTLYYKNDSSYVFAVEKTSAYLTSLTSDIGSLNTNFAGATINYELVVPLGTKSVNLNFTAPDGAVVTVNGSTNAPISLTDGKATASIVVTNGKDTRKYTVLIREIATDATLSSLVVNESNAYSSSIKTLTPEFSANSTSYTAVSLSSSRTFTNIWPCANDSNATVKVCALYGVRDAVAGDEISVTSTNSGYNRYAIYYATGYTSCAVQIVVTAENDVVTKTYQLILTKESSVANVELPVMKAAAGLEIDNYKNASDYRTAQQTELATTISNGKIAIDEAVSVEAVNTALTNAKVIIDAIKTAAELTAEEAAQALVDAKTAAKTALDNYKNASAYRTAQQTELAAAISNGKSAIDEAADAQAVNTALANTKSVIDAIKTNAQLIAEEAVLALTQAKTDAKSTLDSYKNASDYRTAQQTELAAAIANGKTAINDAVSVEAVNTALTNAKSVIDAIKTNAQLTAEEAALTLAQAKTAAKLALDSYKNASDYRTAQQTELAAAIVSGKTAIDTTTSVEAVNTALINAKTVIDAIKTEAYFSEIQTVSDTSGIVIEFTADEVPAGTTAEVIRVDESTASDVFAIVTNSLKEDYSHYVAYDITLYNQGVAIQPNGKVKVKLPIPENFDTSRMEIVKVKDNGTIVKYDFTVEDGFAVFEADSFSVYVIAQKDTAEISVTSPQTGDDFHVLVYLFIGVVSIGLLVMTTKRKKYSSK